MAAFLQSLIAGFGAGGTYALLALSAVLIYRGSGVINFGTGGLALVGAGAFYEVKQTAHAPTILALVAAVAAAALVGSLVEILVMQRMRQASPIARVVATLGLAAAVQGAAQIRYGSNSQFLSSFLPETSLHIAGVTVLLDRMVILAITAGLGVGLWVLYKYTRFGIATTSVAENERVAATLGWSPARISIVNWAIGGGLAGLGGAISSSVVSHGFSYTSLSLAVVPALSAALLGAPVGR